MARSLALACISVVGCGAGCSFSAKLDDNRNGDVIDAPMIDAPMIDAPIDARVGNEAPVSAMTDVTSGADVYLRTSSSPNENTNDRDYVIVDGDLIATAIMRFDLSAIPSSAVVTAAELVLYVDGDPGAPVSVYQLLESWDEATATSNQRAAGMAWLGAGATPPSRGTTAIGTLSPATPNVLVSGAIALPTVQSWVTTPATNFGIAIATTNADGPRFASRERGTVAQRPVLRVSYSN